VHRRSGGSADGRESVRRRSSASLHRGLASPFRDHEGLRNLVLDDASPPKQTICDELGGYPFRGISKDIRRRLPYYWSDWSDAWDYRVIPSTFDMFFKKYGTVSRVPPDLRF
jgi:hypothetical protein